MHIASLNGSRTTSSNEVIEVVHDQTWPWSPWALITDMVCSNLFLRLGKPGKIKYMIVVFGPGIVNQRLFQVALNFDLYANKVNPPDHLVDYSPDGWDDAKWL